MSHLPLLTWRPRVTGVTIIIVHVSRILILILTKMLQEVREDPGRVVPPPPPLLLPARARMQRFMLLMLQQRPLMLAVTTLVSTAAGRSRRNILVQAWWWWCVMKTTKWLIMRVIVNPIVKRQPPAPLPSPIRLDTLEVIMITGSRISSISGRCRSRSRHLSFLPWFRSRELCIRGTLLMIRITTVGMVLALLLLVTIIVTWGVVTVVWLMLFPYVMPAPDAMQRLEAGVRRTESLVSWSQRDPLLIFSLSGEKRERMNENVCFLQTQD